jgi:hypothetical protein
MFRLLAVFALGVLLPGCATITSGTTHTIAVLSEPPGAACQIRRNGELIAVVNPTPGTVSISKSTRDLAVDCTRSGNQPGVAVVKPEFQAMTLGNVLVGGLIGLAVDAASGAMGTYPANVTVVLAPGQFDAAAQRDSFYQSRVEEVRRNFDERIAAVRRNCTPGAPAVCTDQVRTLETQREDDLRQVEQLRQSAPIRGG